MERKTFLTGEKVRLIPFDIERDVERLVQWRRNSEYLRMMGSNPAVQYSKEKIKKWLDETTFDPNEVAFIIQTVDDNRVIGEIGLGGFRGNFVNAFVGISIGEPQDWSKGYGTEAMCLILDYGFCQMNLHHISLTVFEYNPRAIRSYEKVGFKHEGVQRKWLNRNGRRWDMYRMGILKSEWIK